MKKLLIAVVLACRLPPRPWPRISRTCTPRTLAAKRPSDISKPQGADQVGPPFSSAPLPAQNNASGNLRGK